MGRGLAPQRRVLLVCMGNICRSPTAEGVLRAKLHAAGLGASVEVDSAGTHGYHVGDAPDRRAQQRAAARGYDLGGLRARQVVRDDFERFDLILAMDGDNLARLREVSPHSTRAQVGLLMAHAVHHAGVSDVPDPYYGPAAGFDHVLDLVEDACDGLVATLSAASGTS